MIVVIRKDSTCLSLHWLEQHRRIWLSKKTYRTLAQPADPCENPFGAFWRHDMKNTQPHLKAGMGISRTHAHSQWNPVYNALHRFFVVDTNGFVDSSVHVIFTRQTCGQRWSRAAESKRQALENCLSERICNMFSISKCTGDWDLGECTFWVLAKREPLRNAKLWYFSCGRNTFFSEVTIAQRFSFRNYTESALNICVIAKRESLRSGNFRKKTCFARRKKSKKIEIWLS